MRMPPAHPLTRLAAVAEKLPKNHGCVTAAALERATDLLAELAPSERWTVSLEMPFYDFASLACLNVTLLTVSVWNRNLPKNVNISQMGRKFPTSYGTPSLIISRAKLIQSTPSHLLSLTAMWILSYDLHLGLPTDVSFKLPDRICLFISHISDALHTSYTWQTLEKCGLSEWQIDRRWVAMYSDNLV
jgi:hypothetical protein